MDGVTKPDNCTCAYPALIARNMCGHAQDCPVYREWKEKCMGEHLKTISEEDFPKTVRGDWTEAWPDPFWDIVKARERQEGIVSSQEVGSRVVVGQSPYTVADSILSEYCPGLDERATGADMDPKTGNIYEMQDIEDLPSEAVDRLIPISGQEQEELLKVEENLRAELLEKVRLGKRQDRNR